MQLKISWIKLNSFNEKQFPSNTTSAINQRGSLTLGLQIEVIIILCFNAKSISFLQYLKIFFSFFSKKIILVITLIKMHLIFLIRYQSLNINNIIFYISTTSFQKFYPLYCETLILWCLIVILPVLCFRFQYFYFL